MSLRKRLRLYMRIGFLQGMLDEMGHDPKAQGYAFVMKDLSRCRQALANEGGRANDSMENRYDPQRL